jgi:hypothetical protein
MRTITSGTASLLAERPNLRLIHWGNYERTKIESYLERFPDLCLANTSSDELGDTVSVSSA